MFYIVALGNPGEKYHLTRHNVGWQVLDHCISVWELPEMVKDRSLSGRVTDGPVRGQTVAVLYPDTFMNNSGSAVVKLVAPKDTKQLLVVHDDIDLPLGEIKLGKDRGAGGNKGVQSIIDALESKDFIRIRIGIAPKSIWTGLTKRPAGGGPLERFVLQRFSLREQAVLTHVKEKVRLAIETVLTEGLESAMNQYN